MGKRNVRGGGESYRADVPNRANALGSIPLASLINTFKSGRASLMLGYVVAMNWLQSAHAPPHRTETGSPYRRCRARTRWPGSQHAPESFGRVAGLTEVQSELPERVRQLLSKGHDEMARRC
jgi:hypothetical protein